MSESESVTDELTHKKWQGKLQQQQQQRNSYNNVRCSSPIGKSLCVWQKQLAQGSFNVYTTEGSAAYELLEQ